MGTSFGKFTKTKQFRLHVTCLDYIAQHAPYKVNTPAATRTAGAPVLSAALLSAQPLGTVELHIRPGRNVAQTRSPANNTQNSNPITQLRTPKPHPHHTTQVWVKPSAEQSFLYGNHVLKAGLGRITEDTRGAAWLARRQRRLACARTGT